MVDFLGVRARRSFHANYSDDNGVAYLHTDIQPPTSEYFEWISLLSAVAASAGPFTMVELGSGWGRWLLRGAAACRQLRRPFRLIGAEAEPEHFTWMKTAFRDNDIDPDDHLLLNAAIAGGPGEGSFLTGKPQAWYGQRLVSEAEARSYRGEWGMNVALVRQVGLAELLQPIDAVQLVNMDVQGAEADIVEASAETLDRLVEVVHISTHSGEVEGRLRSCFTRLGWFPVFDFECLKTQTTPYGEIGFVDGVQTWVHPSASHVFESMVDGPQLRHALARAALESERSAETTRQIKALSARLLDEEALLRRRAELAYLEELTDFSPAVVHLLQRARRALLRVPFLGRLMRQLLRRSGP